MGITDRWGTIKPPSGSRLDWQHPLTRGLLHYWPINEGGGGRLFDLAGRNTLLVGSTAVWTAGQYGAALQTQSGNETSGGISERAADNTLSAGTLYVLGSPVGLQNDDAGFLYNRSGGGGTHVGLLYNQVSGTARLGYNWADNFSTYAWESSLIVAADRWQHQAISVAPTTATAYLDAASQANAIAHASVLLNGSWTLGFDYFFAFHASATRIACAAVWDRALTAEEIETLYAAPFDLVWRPRSWWMGAPGAGGATLTVAVGGTLSTAGALSKQGRRSLTGTLTETGALAKQSQRNLAGTLTTAGTLTKQPRQILTGTLTMAGAIASRRVVLATIAGTLTTAGTLTKQTRVTLSGAFTPAGALNKQARKSFAGTLASAGALTQQVRKLLVGTLTPGGTISAGRVIVLALAGMLATVGSLAKQTRLALASTLTSSGTLRKLSTKSFTGTLTSAGALLKQPRKLFTGTLTSAGGLSSTIPSGTIFPFSAGGTLTSAGALARRSIKLLTGTLTSSGALVRRLNIALSGVLTSAGQLVKQPRERLGGTVGLSGAFAGGRQLHNAVAGTLTSSGVLVVRRQYVVGMGGTLGFSGALVVEATIAPAESAPEYALQAASPLPEYVAGVASAPPEGTLYLPDGPPEYGLR